jgi:ribosomal protein S18 acetylase RimI-like enzyme
MTIVEATPIDIPEISALVNSAYRGESSKQGWTTEADLLGGIRTNEDLLFEEFNNPRNFFLKCIDAENKIIGSVMLQHKKDKLYLGMLTVNPTIQNQGIGKKLLKAAEDCAKANNKTAVIMTVITARTVLIAWYERHGYINTGRIIPFPMDNPNFGLPTQHLEMVVLEKIL